MKILNIILFTLLVPCICFGSNFTSITTNGPTGVDPGYPGAEVAYYGLDGNNEVVTAVGLTDVSITASGIYSQSDTHFTLNSDITADGDALEFTGTGNVLDLNGYTVTFNNTANANTVGIDLKRASSTGTSPFLIRGPGVIIQGAGNSDDCKGIRFGPGQQMKDATVIVSGAGSDSIYISQYGNSTDWIILENNYIRNLSTTLGASNTESIAVELLKSFNSKIYKNIIVGGHNGIWVSQNGEDGGDTYHKLQNNLILRTKRTIGFKSPAGIQDFWQSHNEISENTIVTEDARGVIVQGADNDNNTVIHNLIDAHYTTTNPGVGFIENNCYGIWQRRGDNNTFTFNRIQSDNQSTEALASGYGIVAGNGSGVNPLLTGNVYSNNTIFVTQGGSQTTDIVSLHFVGTDNTTIVDDNELFAEDIDIVVDGGEDNDLTIIIADGNDSYGGTSTGGDRITASTITNTTLQTMTDLAGPVAPANVTTTTLHDATLIKWDWSVTADVRGYNVYRNAIKVNTVLDGGNAWVDFNTTGTYTVTSVDFDGNESGAPTPPATYTAQAKNCTLKRATLK